MAVGLCRSPGRPPRAPSSRSGLAPRQIIRPLVIVEGIVGPLAYQREGPQPGLLARTRPAPTRAWRRDLLREFAAMSYVVLARKWRPMRFEDLIGQEHITLTLRNAIESDRVAHAYLFTGVRGVGKTTSARILAKALNCLGDPKAGPAEGRAGPTPTPCLACDACRQIAEGTDIDVREIDGASYTGVDEVRKLQDSLPYRPTRDRFKIVIVDEVHMLSQHAWNAFLKTLEEPPPHVKFVFATTEVHKVPVTILSRVQRFDFKLIPTRLILERLQHILAEEGIRAESSALAIIAREAAGSMRDALSLLEQVIAWEASQLLESDVARILGVASRQVLHDLAARIVAGEPAACLDIVARLAAQGFDIAHVARDLLALLRDLVVARVCEDPRELLDLADEEQADVMRLVGQTEVDDLLRLHQGFSQGYDEVVRSGHPRAALEMLLVRLARRPPLLPIDELLQRLGALERRLSAGGGRSGPSGGGPRGRAPSGGRAAGSGKPGGGAAPRVREGRSVTRARKGATPDGLRAVELDASAPAPPTSGVESASQVGDSEGAAPPKGSGNGTSLAVEPASEAKGHGAGSRSASTVASNVELACWRAVVDVVRGDSPQLAACLEHAAVMRLDDAAVRLVWDAGSVFSDQVSAPASQVLLVQALERRMGVRPKLELAFESAEARGAPTLARLNAADRERERMEALERVRQHPGVKATLEILGGRIKEVRLGDE